MPSMTEQDQTYYLSPHLFLYFHEGECVLRDFETHQQWTIEGDYISALKRILKQQSISLSILRELVESEIVTSQPPKGYMGVGEKREFQP